MVNHIEQGELVSACGTKLAIYRTGLKEGPVLVLSNGLGGNIHAWRHIVDYFSDRFRILSWDYRGLFRSGRPRDRRSYGFAHHLQDLERVLAAIAAWPLGPTKLPRYNGKQPAG